MAVSVLTPHTPFPFLVQGKNGRRPLRGVLGGSNSNHPNNPMPRASPLPPPRHLRRRHRRQVNTAAPIT